MSLQQAIIILREHNLYRQALPPYDFDLEGDEMFTRKIPYTPREISQAIDLIVTYLEQTT